MLNIHSQRGLSPLGMLAVLCLVGFCAMFAIKVVPHYMDYSSLKSIHNKASHTSGIMDMPQKKFEYEITKGLQVNGIRTYKTADSTYRSDEDGQPVIGFEYSIKEHLFSNIFVLLEFAHEIPVKE